MGGHLVNSGRCQARVIGTYLTFYTKHVTSGSHDVFMTGLRGWRGMEVKLQANARPQNNFQAVFVAKKSDLVDGNLEHLQACSSTPVPQFETKNVLCWTRVQIESDALPELPLPTLAYFYL